MSYVIHKNAESLDGQVPGEGFERPSLPQRSGSASRIGLRSLRPKHLRSSSNPFKEDCDAGRGIRTLTGITSQRILSPLRLPFRHPG
jgi:hypothetical protein